MAYPTVVLRNVATGRFHPMPFRLAPAPSESGSLGVLRHKSIGHHTAGFDTHEAAVASITSNDAMRWTGETWEWTGEDVPAAVHWFPIGDAP